MQLSIPDPASSIRSFAEGSPLEIRYLICMLEADMVAAAAAGSFATCEFPLQHDFSVPGRYARTIFLPAGTKLVGKLHRHEHPFTIWTGHVTVVTEQGGAEELYGCCHGTSPAGVKRAIYVHTDTVWTVYHEVEGCDLEAIERAVIAESYSELGLEDPVERMKLLTAKSAARPLLLPAQGE